MKWAIAAVVVVLLGAVGGPFVYINFIKDDPPEEAALDSLGTPGTGEPVGVDGRWTVEPSESFVGYRVVEVLFGQDTEGVGRTSEVSGELTIAGTEVTAATFEADMASLESDDERRDRQFRGRIMDTENFPTATFTLTEPIELGEVPADGVRVTATASGELTLRDTTNPVTFDIEAQKNGSTIQVVGSTDIVFADYGIPDPSTTGISTQDHGLLEFDLRFVPA
jgi:polyisoprenoid-binding protein YceI